MGQAFRARLNLAGGKETNYSNAEEQIHTCAMKTVGYLKKKNWFTPEMRTTQMRPTTQARKVDDGMVGSSVLETAEQTSGYGDSSSGAGADVSRFGSSR